MANLTLNPGDRLEIANAPVIVEYALFGCAAKVEARTATGQLLANVKYNPAKKLLILPQVPQDSTIYLSTLTNEPFPDDSYGFITILQNNVGGSTSIRLPKTELGGVYSQPVLSITPSAKGLILSLPDLADDGGQLSSLAKNARQAAIEKLGVNHVAEPVSTLVVIDDSASMRVRTSEILNVLHVLEGVNSISAANQQVALAVVGDATDIRYTADLTEGFNGISEVRPAYTGANLADASIFRFLSSNSPGAVIIITDGVPSAIKEIERIAQEHEFTAPKSSVSLILLMDNDAALFEPTTNLNVTTLPGDLDHNKNSLPQMVASILNGVKL